MKATFILLVTLFFSSVEEKPKMEIFDCPTGQISYNLSCGSFCDTPPSPWTSAALIAKTAQLEESNCGEGGGEDTLDPS